MKRYVFLVLAAVLSGCAQNPPQLVQKIDPYTKKQQYGLGPIETVTCPGGAPISGEVAIGFVGEGDLNAMYINLLDDSWAFLNPKLPLDLLIDGEATQLMAIQGSSRDVQKGGRIKETLYYPLSKNFASRLAKAKFVQFRVMGSKAIIERCLVAEQLQQVSTIVPLVP